MSRNKLFMNKKSRSYAIETKNRIARASSTSEKYPAGSDNY
jgi:hypothetical protein